MDYWDQMRFKRLGGTSSKKNSSDLPTGDPDDVPFDDSDQLIFVSKKKKKRNRKGKKRK